MRKRILMRLWVFVSLVHSVSAQIPTKTEHQVRYFSNEVNCGDLKQILGIVTWKFEVAAPQGTSWFPVSLSCYEGNKMVSVLGKTQVGVAVGKEADKKHRDTLIIALQPLDGGTLVTASKVRLSWSGFNSPGDSFVFENPFAGRNEGVITLVSPEQADDLTFKLLESRDGAQRRDIRLRLDLDAREGKYLK